MAKLCVELTDDGLCMRPVVRCVPADLVESLTVYVRREKTSERDTHDIDAELNALVVRMCSISLN